MSSAQRKMEVCDLEESPRTGCRSQGSSSIDKPHNAEARVYELDRASDVDQLWQDQHVVHPTSEILIEEPTWVLVSHRQHGPSL